MLVTSIDDIRVSIKEIINLRDTEYSNHVTKASNLWAPWLDMLSFVTELSDKSLEKIRLHTGFGFFLGSNWSTCYYEKNEIELGIKNIFGSKYIADYLELTRSVDQQFHCSEIDKNKSLISILFEEKYINEDVLRFQSTISNLSNLKNKKIKRCLEIGAGYGGLCNQFKKIFQPDQSIVIDHPEVLFWSIVYTFINNPDCSIEIITDSTSTISDSDFIFIPAFLTDVIKDYEVDLLINENSFCEMTDRQIQYYLDTLSFKLLYSNNRNRQFMNLEASDLNTILQKNFHTMPALSFYQNKYENYESRNNLKYHFFASRNSGNLPVLNTQEICGLSVRTSH